MNDGDHKSDAATQLVAAGGRLYLDPADRTVWLDGRTLELRGRPFQLLETLMVRPQRLVTKAELIEEVWGGLAVSDAVLTTAMRELRQALGDDARRPRWVKTEHRQGYRFLAAVTAADKTAGAARTLETAAGPAAHEGVVATATAAADSLQDQASNHAGPSQRWLTPARAATAALLALAAVVILLAGPRNDVSAAPEQSVAVLGFASLSDDDEARWFSDGLSEEISAALGRLPDLRVAPRRATLAFDNEADTGLDAIGQALNVAHLVDGTVRLDGDRVRVTVSLIEAQSGVQRWSETYDRDFADILSLQADIAVHVARILNTALDASALEAMVSAGTESIAAYEAYLRAQALIAEFSRTGDAAHWYAALPLLDRARSIDPSFAEAHAEAARVFRYTNTPSLVMVPNPLTGEAYRQAYSERMNAAVAAARDPLQAAVYRARRDQELFVLDDAREAYATYLAERANDIDQWFDYSNTLVMMGLHTEAREAVRELDALIPASDLQNRGMLIQHARKARDFSLAVQIGQRALERDPYHSFSLLETQIAMHYAGLHEQAAVIATRIQESELGRFARVFSQIYQICAAGDGAQALQLGQMFLDEPRAVFQGYNILRMIGREDEAYARIAQLDEPGVPGRLREMLFDPSFDARRMPHLAEAMRNAGAALVEPEPFLVSCSADT